MRKITESDADALGEIYYRAVDLQLREYYEDSQIDYYLKFPRDHNKFGKFIFLPETWVFERNGKPVGFSGIEDTGHLTSLYVDPEYSRQGIGTKLLRHIISIAEKKDFRKIHTEANPLSKAFFLKNGFKLLSEETRYRDDIPFVRFNMEFHF